jgi:hypothetical protein
MTRRINPRKSKSGQPVPITRDKLLHGIDYIVVSGGGSASTPFSIEKKDADDSRVFVSRPKIFAGATRERTATS